MLDLRNGCCLELLQTIPDNYFDMICADLPYGTTNCKWDSTIPLKDYITIKGINLNKNEFILHRVERGVSHSTAVDAWNASHKKGLWFHLERVAKPTCPIVLFAQTPFDKILGCSNLPLLRYEWIWEKTAATGHLNAKKMPMKAHENILVFYKKLPTYNPQKTKGHKPVNTYTKRNGDGECYGKTVEVSGGGATDRYPRSVLKFSSDKQTNRLHPTQKPIALCKYIVETYSNVGDKVGDFCMGSGSLGAAAAELKRHFTGFEKDKDIFEVAQDRICAI